MTRFQETVKYATAYRIDRGTEGDVNDWVVKHTTRSNKIVRDMPFQLFDDTGKYPTQ